MVVILLHGVAKTSAKGKLKDNSWYAFTIMDSVVAMIQLVITETDFEPAIERHRLF
jgi:hypothetical protein